MMTETQMILMDDPLIVLLLRLIMCALVDLAQHQTNAQYVLQDIIQTKIKMPVYLNVVTVLGQKKKNEMIITQILMMDVQMIAQQ